MEDMSDLKYWVAISQNIKIGAARFKKLYNFFPDMETVWKEATTTDLTEAGFTENIAEDFVIRRHDTNPDEEMEKMAKENIKAVTVHDEKYPSMLKELFTPPAILYYKGDIESITPHSLAIVGTRKISSYGKLITNQIVQKLAPHEISIISGLAHGVDTEAHLTSLKYKTHTVAVLGSGLDHRNIYPAINRRLAEDIVNQGGVVLSEYPVGMMPLRHNFPARNRIISGLSKATLVIEAGEVSGALITANYALDQNREVIAVPGNLTNPNSGGTNKLIKQGAIVFTDIEDILEIFNYQQIKQSKVAVTADNPEEEAVIKILSTEPTHIDQLVLKSGLPSSMISSTLTMMELSGKVKNLGNMNYVLL